VKRIQWIQHLPWRRIGIGFAVTAFLLVAVPPFRRAVVFEAPVA
jgi:hypothetical protein